MTKNSKIHGIVCWFDIEFGHLENIVWFSTSPRAHYPHWKSTVFYFDGDFDGKSGDILKGSIAAKKSKTNFRELDIKISYHFEHFENGKVQS